MLRPSIDKKYYVYLIYNKINNKIYIGKANTLRDRWAAHLATAKYKYESSYSYIHKSINKYGKENFIFDIISEYFDDESTAYDTENYFIKLYQSNKSKIGYNLNDGGRRPKHSIESIAKISASKMGHFVSKEARLNMSLAHIGQIASNKKLTDNSVKSLREDYIITKYLSMSISKFKQDKAKELNVSEATIDSLIDTKYVKYKKSLPNLNFIERVLGFPIELFEQNLIKACSKCHQILNKEDFYVDKKTSTKLSSHCKNCNSCYK